MSRPSLRSLPRQERWRLLRGRITLVGVVCISIYVMNLWIMHLQVHVKLGPSHLPGVVDPQQGGFQQYHRSQGFSRTTEPRPRRPPLNQIVQGWNVTGDPSWLLNLAIIGFPKTGTSTLMHYLHKSPAVHVFDEERCEMEYNQHVKLIESLYQDMPPGDLIRGIKCPRDLESNLALSNYQQFFPQADFMIGLRHPVEWFESLYNFRVQNLFDMPPAETLIGRCKKQNIGVCTFRGNFHLFLANLGKTNISTNPSEYQWIAPEYQKLIHPVVTEKKQRRIFLWDISQLHQDNYQFRHDLQDFLQLQEELPPMIWVKPGFHHKQNQTVIQDVNSRKINICHDQYQSLRQVLVAQGTNASRWIQTYFLNAEGVHVSNKDHFVHTILRSWEQDPCTLSY